MSANIKLNDPDLLRQQCYVDGAWVDATGGSTIEVENPATGQSIGSVPGPPSAQASGSAAP